LVAVIEVFVEYPVRELLAWYVARGMALVTEELHDANSVTNTPTTNRAPPPGLLNTVRISGDSVQMSSLLTAES
jgi:hypothetical protein